MGPPSSKTGTFDEDLLPNFNVNQGFPFLSSTVYVCSAVGRGVVEFCALEEYAGNRAKSTSSALKGGGSMCAIVRSYWPQGDEGHDF